MINTSTIRVDTVNKNKEHEQIAADVPNDNVAFLYERIDEILSVNDFELLDSRELDPRKALYQNKVDQKTWMISKKFEHFDAKQFIAATLYRLILGNALAPNIQLIKKEVVHYLWGAKYLPDFISQFFITGKENHYFLGSEFLPGAITLADVLHNCTKENFDLQKALKETELKAGEPWSDELKRERENALTMAFFKRLLRGLPDNCAEIVGYEDVLAAMIILNEDDGHIENLVIVPDPDAPGKFTLAKIDHEYSLLGHLRWDAKADDEAQETNLRTIIEETVLATKNRPMWFHSRAMWFRPDKIDLLRLSQAFERIHAIPDEVWEGSLLRAVEQLKDKGLSGPSDKESVVLALKRKAHAKHYAISLKVEAAIQSGNLGALQQLVKEGAINIDEAFHAINIDLSETRLLTPLEMAVYYKKKTIVEWLGSQNVHAETTRRALDIAIEVKNLRAFIQLRPQEILSSNEFLTKAIEFDNVAAVNHVERVTGVKLVDDFEKYLGVAIQVNSPAIVEKLLNEKSISSENLLQYISISIDSELTKASLIEKLLDFYIRDEETALTAFYLFPGSTKNTYRKSQMYIKTLTWIEDVAFLNMIYDSIQSCGLLPAQEFLFEKLKKKGVVPRLYGGTAFYMEKCRQYV